VSRSQPAWSTSARCDLFGSCTGSATRDSCVAPDSSTQSSPHKNCAFAVDAHAVGAVAPHPLVSCSGCRAGSADPTSSLWRDCAKEGHASKLPF